MRKEKWRPVVGFEGRYIVSDTGKVVGLSKYSNLGSRPMSRIFDRKGYPFLWLYTNEGNGKLKRMPVHKIVAAAFLGPCPFGKEVNHKDANKKNPRLSNLEYVTWHENRDHARVNDCLAQKLDRHAVFGIRYFYKKGFTGRELAKAFQVSPSGISCVVKRKTWSHV